MDKSSLIYPLFVREGSGIREEIPSMPGQYRYSLDEMPYKLESLTKAGVGSVILFGIPDVKDEKGSQAYAEDGIVQRAIRRLKKDFPDLYCVTDVCLCEYTSHGHCGMLCGHEVENDSTVELLAKTALSHVEAGADMVAPSDMMDGRILAMRKTLDANGHKETPIMSYAVKYASAFYGPFREAAGSAPAFGDRKSYQMDPHNSREGVKEALLDVEEGADIRGYYVWSLMDNWEWNAGFTSRYGLTYVDFDTQKRTVKDSGRWYQDLIRRRTLELSDDMETVDDAEVEDGKGSR